MADTNLFWILRGTYEERKRKLGEMDRALLEACILDSEYNEFLRGHADYRDGEPDHRGYGKRIPYLGWFWRHLEFSDGALPIGDSGAFIGFMANNKWGHPERTTTPEEFATIMAIIDAAMLENEKGGSLKSIQEATDTELTKLWDYMQTLEMAVHA